MQTTAVVTRENWMDQAKVVLGDLWLEDICHYTRKKSAIVYKYSRGERRAPDAWLAQVAAILEGARLRS